MKKLLILLVTPFICSGCFAQISFEKGHFINNNGERINCLIKNIDWKNNPIDFKFQYTKNSEINTATIELVKEFEITNGAKYQRYTVNLDRSPNYLNNDIEDLTYDRNPLFNKEQIFLKVLVEGQASLYQFEDGNIIRFFYKVDNSNPEQLVFKNFRTPQNEVGENNLFRQQLLNTLKCSTITVSDLE